MDLIKDIIKVDNRVDFGRFQTFIEAEVVVPDKKDDVYDIIKTEGYISLKKQEVLDGKIILRGSFNYNVIYLSEDKKTVSNVEGRIDLNEVVEKDNIIAEMENMLKAEVEHIDCNIINERKIRVGALVNVKGSLFEKSRIDIVKDIAQVEDIQKHRKEVQYEDIVGIEKSESVIRDTVAINNQEIETLVSLSPKVKVKETRVSDNKVIVGGTLEINPVAYTYEGQLVELDRFGLDFTQFIEVPGASDGMREEAMVEIVDFMYTLKQNEENSASLLEIDATLRSKVKVCEDVSREVLQDAYCPYRNLKFENRNVELNKIVDGGVEYFNIRETIRNSNEDIQIKDIVNVDANIFVENNSLLEGKNTVEGIVKVDLLYTPVEGLRPVYRLTEEIPFKHTIDLSQDKDTMSSYSTVEVDRVEYDLNRDQIDISIKAKRYTEVLDRVKDKFIVKGEDHGVIDMSLRPSITIYIAKDGDKIWDVAKRYNTTIDEIIEVNEIKKEDGLREGQCLIIEKKVVCEL